MVTRLQVRKALVEYGLQHKTNAEIDAAMAQVDQQAIIAAERAKYTVKVWDKQTPINGVPAEIVIESHRIPEHGTAYMICQGERIIFFQSRDPFTGAIITPESAQAIGEAHLDQFVESAAQQTIVEAIIEKLDV